jgi:ABC-type branched-subunit amino acid transport system substrate-binding protein
VSAGLLLGLGACSSSSHSTSSNTTTAAGSASTAGSASASTAAPTGTTSKPNISVGLAVDITGVLSAISEPGLYAMEAGIAEYNASPTGKYHVSYKVYDTQGSPTGGLTAAREMVADHVFAVLAVSVGLDSGLATLSAAGVPTVGNGDTVNWSHRTGIFSYEGNEITQNTTSWMDLLLNQGRKNIAIPTGPGYGAAAGPTWNAEVPFAGGKTCFYRTGIDATNTATLTAVAHEIISAGCQGVDSLLVSNTVGLQVTLNQLGGNVQVVDPADFGPAVISQYGSSANGLIYANFFASPYATGNPGVNEYLAAMKQYEPSHDPYCFCEKGYAVVKWFTWGLDQVPPQPTQTALVNVLNTTNGYNEDGLIGPIQEPAFHSSGQLCLGASVVKNGHWVSLYNGPNAMVCGKRYVFTKS